MFPDEVTEDKAVIEFRKAVSDLNFDDDAELRRFLRARNHDIKKAEDMLRKSIIWRKTNKLDEAYTWELPEIIIKSFPFYIDGVDRDGRKVFYFPAGRWEVRKMITNGYIEYMDKYIYQTISTLIRVVTETNHQKFVIIIDLAEMTYWKIAHYETVQMILKVFREYEQNFPERLKAAFVINAPWVLNCIFPLVKPLLTGRTMQKVQIFDNSPKKYLPAILDVVPESGLPSGFREYFEDEIIEMQM